MLLPVPAYCHLSIYTSVSLLPLVLLSAVEVRWRGVAKQCSVRIIRIIYPLYIHACALCHRVPVSDRNLKIRNLILNIFSTFSEFLAAENYPLYGIWRCQMHSVRNCPR